MEGGAMEETGGAWRDPGHSQNSGPRWSRWREEPWRRQEEPGGTQATAKTVAHGGADGGRSHGGDRRSLAGPRPQPKRWPTVEPMEGGAMEEEWPLTPGGRPMTVVQVEEEPEVEMESQRARATGRIRGTKAEQMAPATEAETGIQMGAGATED